MARVPPVSVGLVARAPLVPACRVPLALVSPAARVPMAASRVLEASLVLAVSLVRTARSASRVSPAPVSPVLVA
ncbi:hypothetical protein, partial [Streptomyces oryzae]|uniref:hypothetical protein n=1 Tax=Streptomyces oryzae TaxID=1434886 RepID=UPI001ADAACF7